MSFLETHAKELVSLLVPIVTWLVNRLFRTRVKLLLGTPHSFLFIVPEPRLDQAGKVISPTQSANSTSIILKNAGKETAKNIELVFNWKPPCLNIWPPRHFTEHVATDNRYSIIFESLAPNELIACEMLSINYDNPALITARCEQCVAQNIEMLPQPVAPNWLVRTMVTLSFVGLGSAVYLLILLIQFLVLKTPYGH